MRAEVLAETLREQRRALLWWGAGLAALVALTVSFYPWFRDDPALAAFGEDLPETLRALFVGGELDIASPAGYLNSQIFEGVAILVLFVFAIAGGTRAVAGEEERGTLELVLAHPIGRRDYVAQRFLALVALVALLSAVLFASVVLGSWAVRMEVAAAQVLAASVSVGLLALVFGAVALAVGAARPGRSRAIAAATGLAIVSWLLEGLGQFVDVLEPVRPLSPFYQALAGDPLREGALWGEWGLLAAVSVLLAVVAAVGLERRDVRQ